MRQRLRTKREDLLADLLAGATNALSYVPQGMAYAVVAGVSPTYGLYTGVFAPLIGALVAGSSFMVITVTNELAMPTGEILASAASIRALFTLTLLIGLIQLSLGLLKFGGVTRFISHCVTTGFVAGVGVLLILGQLQKLTGYKGTMQGNVFVKTWDWLTHLNGIDWRTTVVGITTVVVIVGLQRTRLKPMALVGGLVLTTVLVSLLRWNSVGLVGGISRIPRGLPSPVLPDWRMAPQLFVPALSLAVLGLSIAAGVSQNYPEPDGTMPDTSRDFLGQGLANICGGFFQGMPAGGSISRTATSVSAGARTRWANIFAGLILGLFLLSVGSAAELVPMAALAGLLVYIGFNVIHLERITRVWNTHTAERAAMVATFLLTLFIPLHWAISAGVAITLLLYIYSSSTKVRLVQIVPDNSGGFEEHAAPDRLASGQVTVLHGYGNAFFAAVYALEASLPRPEEARNAVVLFGLRGRESLTSSAIAMLERYIRRLRSGGNELMLFGVEPAVKRELKRTGMMGVLGDSNVFDSTSSVGGSFKAAWAAAHELVKRKNSV
jgi:SulP family sulfate permease